MGQDTIGLRRVLPVVAALLAANAAPARATEVDDQAWFTLTAARQMKVVTVQLDLNTRLTDEFSRMSQQNARLTVTTPVSDAVDVGGGYFFGYSELPDVPDIVEHRPFEQVAVRIGMPKGMALTSRTRLEERFRQGAGGMGLRAYEWVRLQTRLSEKLTLINQVEMAWNLNTTAWGQKSGFSSARGSVAISIPLSKNLNFQPGYTGQYVKRYRAEARFINGLLINLVYRG